MTHDRSRRLGVSLKLKLSSLITSLVVLAVGLRRRVPCSSSNSAAWRRR